MKDATLFFHQVGQIRVGELSIGLSCSKSRDLQSEHGFRACSFKNKGKNLDVHTFGSQQTKTNGTIERNRSNFGPLSSRWYQNDREGRREYFRKIWAWKTSTKTWKNRLFSGLFHIVSSFSRGLNPEWAESTYKRLGPISLFPAGDPNVIGSNNMTNGSPILF